jgi:pyroglutamyl-peptidase
MANPVILLTGFAPYREDINASAELVKSFSSDLPPQLAHLKDILACEIVRCDDTSRETEHQSLEARLLEILKQHTPELCIHTGQAPPCDRIMIEMIATNSFMRETIDPERPVAYWSNLPDSNNLVSALEASNIPASYSSDAGQHLCNHILYSSLYFAEKHNLCHKSGFIHIPILPQQAHKHHDAPAMPLELSRKALSVIISHVARIHSHDK